MVPRLAGVNVSDWYVSFIINVYVKTTIVEFNHVLTSKRLLHVPFMLDLTFYSWTTF
jgi:hypothetical protein